MRTSDTIAEIAKAFAKAQSEMSDPKMSGLGQVGGKKTAARKYPYALLTDILAVARESLAKNGIGFVQSAALDRNALITRLVHSSGEWMEFDYPLSRSADPQAQGSANTYARRYSLMSILGVAGEKDDDGAGAKGKVGRRLPKPSAPPGENHHASWKADRVPFCAALTKAGTNYKDASAFAVYREWGKPSEWDSARRQKYFGSITDGGLKDDFTSFAEG